MKYISTNNPNKLIEYMLNKYDNSLTSKHYHHLMYLFASYGKIKQCKMIMESYIDQPNITTKEYLLLAYCNIPDMFQASVLVNTIFKSGLKLTPFGYKSLRNGYLKANDPLGGLFLIRKMMNEYKWNNINYKEYINLLHLFAKTGDIKTFLSLYQHLEKLYHHM